MMNLALALMLAQTLTVTIKPATPFTLTWDQPADPSGVAVAMPKFRIWCDGAIVKNLSTEETIRAAAAAPNADGSTTITTEAPGLPAGNHSCFVSAFNDVGESKGAPIPIVVGTAPATPIRLRVVIQVGGGGQ